MNMKAFFMVGGAAFALLAAYSLSVSCGRLGEDGAAGTPESEGKLCVSIDPCSEACTKAGPEIPDTNDFILTICSSEGKTVYEGAYGDCPESVDVPAGSYIVRAVSREFNRPAFASPQFGDEQCVVVPSGGRVGVRLVCMQMNAGVSLDVSERFLTECDDAVLFLQSGAGRLMYSYSEKRVAYFPPGGLSLLMSAGGSDRVLYSRELIARDMVTIKVHVAGSETGYGGLSMSVDTARVWSVDECLIGGGGQESDVMTVAQAMSSIGKEDVWVSGYVVGGDLTSASAKFEPPFRSRTNLLLGPRSSTVDRSACISVQLPEGSLRDALNLVDNPELHKKRVMLKGDMDAAYYGIPGLKNTSDYELEN